MLITKSCPDVGVDVSVNHAGHLTKVVLFGLSDQLLGSKKFLDAWPDVGLTHHLVIPPVDTEAVLGTVASQPAPRAPVGLQGVLRTTVADLGVSQELVQT